MTKKLLVALFALGAIAAILAIAAPLAHAQQPNVVVSRPMPVAGATTPMTDIDSGAGGGMAILFWAFALAAVGGALFVVSRKNLIAAVMGMVGSFLGIAAVYMLLYAQFLAVIQMLVYAGAIMVLFVYVIMLLNAGEEEHSRGSRVAWMVGGPATALGAGILIWILVRGTALGKIQIGEFVGSTDNVALLLFKDYLLPFEVTSVLILIAIMGAVVLARREH